MSTPASKQSPILIAGAGLSGLSLALELAKRPFFQDKEIILIDREDKSRNDRTWCFWAKPAEIIPPIAYRTWDQCLFFGQNLETRLDISPYQYHMIRGADFYEWAKSSLAKHPNIQWVTANITGFDPENGIVKTAKGDYQGAWIFNSAHYPTLAQPWAGKFVDGAQWNVEEPPNRPPSNATFLLQHFKGWLLETPNAAFNPAAVTFMDYRLEQAGETRFVYVLPLSETRALVEFTVFSEALCPTETYDQVLAQYLSNTLNIKDYKVIASEFGVIPMTDLPLSPKGQGRVIHIGTAGGFVKASSGYAFLRTQRKMRAFVDQWEKSGAPEIAALQSAKGFRMLDAIMLRVLREGLVPGKVFFSMLFKKLPGRLVFRFLDEDASLFDVLRVLSAPPTWPFFKTALRQIPQLLRILVSKY